MALLESLDAVVTVDTSVGHLAAAMGKPTWILLATSPARRWLLQRSDTPWYPTVRLFRQTRPRVWDDVFQSVAAALAAPAEPDAALAMPERKRSAASAG
jgi:ADP-heptose:LPS heptosyltransferase